jgi:hypothetical protein
MSRHSMCTWQVSRKTHIFCVLCKKDKKNVSCNANFSTKICGFYTQPKKNHFLMKQLCENIECQDQCVKKFIQFFQHFKFCLKHISKTGRICSRVPKRCPQLIVYIKIFYSNFLKLPNVIFEFFKNRLHGA